MSAAIDHADTRCGNRWKFGKDECARERGHIGPHRTTETSEAHSFRWFDNEGVSAEQPRTLGAVDHAARFAALDEYRLFAMEDGTGDGTAAAGFVESLLSVLADWRPRIVALLESGPAWSIPEVAAYERAVNRTQEAWLFYSFRYMGGPDLPETFALPEAAPKGHAQTVTPVARITSPGRRSLIVREVAA